MEISYKISVLKRKLNRFIEANWRTFKMFRLDKKEVKKIWESMVDLFGEMQEKSPDINMFAYDLTSSRREVEEAAFCNLWDIEPYEALKMYNIKFAEDWTIYSMEELKKYKEFRQKEQIALRMINMLEYYYPPPIYD